MESYSTEIVQSFQSKIKIWKTLKIVSTQIKTLPKILLQNLIKKNTKLQLFEEYKLRKAIFYSN